MGYAVRVLADADIAGETTDSELARRVAPHGRAVGLDIDEVKLGLAREDLVQLARNSIIASFLPQEAKREWLIRIERFAVEEGRSH